MGQQTHPCPGEEHSPGFSAARISRLLQQRLVYERCGAEHYRMVQEQADLAGCPGPVVDCLEELMQLQQRHVRIHIFDKRPQESVLEPHMGHHKDALLQQIHPVLGRNAVGDRLDEGRPLTLKLEQWVEQRSASGQRGRSHGGCRGGRRSARGQGVEAGQAGTGKTGKVPGSRKRCEVADSGGNCVWRNSVSEFGAKNSRNDGVSVSFSHENAQMQ